MRVNSNSLRNYAIYTMHLFTSWRIKYETNKNISTAAELSLSRVEITAAVSKHQETRKKKPKLLGDRTNSAIQTKDGIELIDLCSSSDTSDEETLIPIGMQWYILSIL